ncbi:MAG: helix-turn-helix transcriptional regulator [Anaerovoracaceae bacterium]
MNKYKLEYEMKKKKIGKSELCKILNISRSSFYRKCNGTSEFTQSEIKAIMEILGIKSPMDIFFDEEVSLKTQNATIV